STFGCHASASVIDLLVEDDGGADAGTNGRVENRLVSNGGAPHALGESSGVGVVIDVSGTSVFALDGVCEREVDPARQVWRIDDDTGLDIQGAGGNYANLGDGPTGDIHAMANNGVDRFHCFTIGAGSFHR